MDGNKLCDAFMARLHLFLEHTSIAKGVRIELQQQWTEVPPELVEVILASNLTARRIDAPVAPSPLSPSHSDSLLDKM